MLLLLAFTLHCEVFCGNGFIHCPTSNAFFFDSDSVKAGSRLNGKLSRAMEKEAHEINHLACGLDLVVFGFTSGSLVGCWSVIITLYCPLQCFPTTASKREFEINIIWMNQRRENNARGSESQRDKEQPAAWNKRNREDKKLT